MWRLLGQGHGDIGRTGDARVVDAGWLVAGGCKRSGDRCGRW